MASSSQYTKQMELIKKASELSLQNQSNHLKNTLNSLLSSYQTQQNALNAQLETDTNQNEVERYKAQRALRETLANRGAMDSGAGRQEALNQANAYSNRYQTIKNAYNTNLNDLRNNANSSIAEMDNTYSQSIGDANSNILSKLSEFVGSGYKNTKDWTVKDDNWSSYLADLKKQYGL